MSLSCDSLNIQHIVCEISGSHGASMKRAFCDIGPCSLVDDVPLKRRSTPERLHGAVSQKTIIFIKVVGHDGKKLCYVLMLFANRGVLINLRVYSGSRVKWVL
jgi:hypothetical protein